MDADQCVSRPSFDATAPRAYFEITRRHHGLGRFPAQILDVLENTHTFANALHACRRLGKRANFRDFGGRQVQQCFTSLLQGRKRFLQGDLKNDSGEEMKEM